jgi:hypothetical protein
MQKILRDVVTGAIPRRIITTYTCAAVRPSQHRGCTHSSLRLVSHYIKSSAVGIMFELSFVDWKGFRVA